MANRGDGSPSGLSGAPFDWGDGSPTPASWGATTADLGDGSPSSFGILVEVIGGRRVYRDDGGEIVELLAEWPVLGPYRVSLIDVAGDPTPSDGYCYSAAPGRGHYLYANGARDTLRFAMPPAPPGLYTIHVEWQPGGGGDTGYPEPSAAAWSGSADVPVRIRVATRPRLPQAWSMRRRLPPSVFKAATGPRDARTETLLVEV